MRNNTTVAIRQAKLNAFAPLPPAPLSWSGPMAIAARAIRRDIALLQQERSQRGELAQLLYLYADDQLRRVGAISGMLGPLRKSAQQLEWRSTLRRLPS